MKIEEASQFLQANAVAGRVRQLILGAVPKVKTTSRRPTAIALAELAAGKLEVYDPREAAELLADDSEDLSQEDRAANEAARASFEQMFAGTDRAVELDEPEVAGEDAEPAAAAAADGSGAKASKG